MTRAAICISVVFLFCVRQSRSEPHRYEGDLNEHPIIAFVEFREDDNSVAGLFYKKDDPERAFVFKGSNPRQGLIQIRVAQGENRVGIAELEKSPSSDSITWQGQMRFADDVSLALSFSRPSTTAGVSEVESDAQPGGPTETAEFHRNRALKLEDDGNLDAAIVEYGRAIKCVPTDVTAYTFRADDKWKTGQLESALADYRHAIAIDSDFHRALNGLAWKLATCTDAQLRDGKKAKTLALKACEVKDSARNTDTLAAAYAEIGNFEEAIYTEKRAIEKGQEENISEQTLNGYRQRLQLYEDHEPYRTSGDD